MPRGQTTSKLCEICNKEISLFAYNRHKKAHSNPVSKVNCNLSNNSIFEKACAFCSKLYKSKLALNNHQVRCKENPNRKIQVLTEKGRKSIIEHNKSRIWTEEQKRAHSERMKAAVENNPESYSSSNRGRTKQIIIDGIKLQGQWEVDFYCWAKHAGLNPSRPTHGFKYVWNGERTYYPDFYIELLDLYVEVKGYETERDRAKWLQFPKKLRIIKEDEIKQIRKGCFVGL